MWISAGRCGFNAVRLVAPQVLDPTDFIPRRLNSEQSFQTPGVLLEFLDFIKGGDMLDVHWCCHSLEVQHRQSFHRPFDRPPVSYLCGCDPGGLFHPRGHMVIGQEVTFFAVSPWGRSSASCQVMGSNRILKVLWGANGDCQCLMSPGRNLLRCGQSWIGVVPELEGALSQLMLGAPRNHENTSLAFTFSIRAFSIIFTAK